MKFYHVTPTLATAKKIASEGVSTSISKMQGGGFFIWNSIERAKSYCNDDYITERGDEPHILVFDIEPSAQDFDLDYEGSNSFLVSWVQKNKEKIADLTGTKLELLTAPTFISPEYPEGKPLFRNKVSNRVAFYAPPAGGTQGYDGPSEDFYREIKKIPELEQSMENEAFKAAIKGEVSAFKYVGPAVYPIEILTATGSPIEEQMNNSLNERRFSVSRWKLLAGI